MNPANATTPQWLVWISRKKQETAYVLFALAIAALGLFLWLIWKHQQDWMPEIVFSAALVPIFLAAGAWYLNRENDSLTDVQAARILVLAVGALIGLCCELDAAWRTKEWWTWITNMEKWQGPERWRVIFWAAATLLGLAIMFASLMFGRQEEQSHPMLRWLIYGYNMALVILLTLFVIVVVNVIAFLYIPATSDWTKNKLYSLNASKSQNILKSLDEPVEIVVLARFPGDPIADELTRLVENCRNYTSKIAFPITIYYKDRNKPEVDDLVDKHSLTHDVGVLVYYGEEKTKWQFIEESDLSGGHMGGREFKGEAALMTALGKLKKDQPAVYYFTQGHGELSLQPGPRDQCDSSLKKKLEKSDQVRGLTFGSDEKASDESMVTSASVPEDASAVIIAGYDRPFETQEVQALRKYAKGDGRKDGPGKLLIMLGVVKDSEGRMVESGLEPLLDEFGVKLGNNRVMAWGGRVKDPEMPFVVAKTGVTQGAERKLTVSLEKVFLQLRGLRTVEAKPGGPGDFRVEPLFVVSRGLAKFTWAEEDLKKSTLKILGSYFGDDADPRLQDPEKIRRAKSDPKFTTELSVAVTVADGKGQPRPRMVVIGNSDIASDEFADESREGPDFYYSIVASSLGYLREKPEDIGIEATKRETYTLSKQAQEDISAMRMQPFAFMFFGVIGLGLCVWVVRRR